MATIIPMSTIQEFQDEARPVFRRGMAPRPQRVNFATETHLRLALLAGQRCPHCGDCLVFDGRRLLCDNTLDCVHAWSNPDVAESEVYHGMSAATVS